MSMSDVNHEMNLAWDFVEKTGVNIFLTGKAGTGKTTFLKRLREKSPKRMIVVAPTGVAAINAEGVTIHSFFQLPLSPYLPDSRNSADKYRFGKEKKNIIKSLDLLVIDEISMVRADLLDAIDSVLRRYKDRSKPFGGVQLLMIGDLQQLSPVVKDGEWDLLSKYYNSPYFFDSHALKNSEYITIELKTVYRQTDTAFINVLNSIRENRIDSNILNLLNSRFTPDYENSADKGYIKLTTHNFQAQEYNNSKLGTLPSKEFTYEAEVSGNFPQTSFPADAELKLKKGAQVMFIKNDFSDKHSFFNGKIGKVVNLDENSIEVQCAGEETIIKVSKMEWENMKYTIDDETKEIKEEVEGVFTQFPLKPAWAITIHKSQGLTFDNVIIDTDRAFAHGQVYVALSRCRSLEGIILTHPISPDSIISDNTIESFTRSCDGSAECAEKKFDSYRFEYFMSNLDELFNFSFISMELNSLCRIFEEFLYNSFPKALSMLRDMTVDMKQNIIDICIKFKQQYTQILLTSENYSDDKFLNERIIKGAHYFFEKTKEITENVSKLTGINPDNKITAKRLKENLDSLTFMLNMKLSLLEHTASNGFSVASYLDCKAKTALELSEKQSPHKGKKKSASEAKMEVPSDIGNAKLLNSLVKWRREKAAELNVPAYVVLQQKALICISNAAPQTIDELKKIPYFGAKSIEKYGTEIINIIQDISKTD